MTECIFTVPFYYNIMFCTQRQVISLFYAKQIFRTLVLLVIFTKPMCNNVTNIIINIIIVDFNKSLYHTQICLLLSLPITTTRIYVCLYIYDIIHCINPHITIKTKSLYGMIYKGRDIMVHHSQYHPLISNSYGRWWCP